MPKKGNSHDTRAGAGRALDVVELPTLLVPPDCRCIWIVIRTAPGIAAVSRSRLKYRHLLCPHRHHTSDGSGSGSFPKTLRPPPAGGWPERSQPVADTTQLGDRMKGYEAASRYVLPRRTYTLIRVDGRAFHSHLRHAGKPFDYAFMRVMDDVAADLCAEISGAILGYAQSDEVSVLLTDFGSVHTEPWFGGGVQKIASTAASTATAAFLCRYTQVSDRSLKPPTFDARVFTISDPVEVANYFVWRQRDAVRNSVSMAGQAHFPHQRLQHLNSGQVQELLWSEKNINWNDYPDGAKRGRVCQRVTGPEDVTWTDKRTGTTRTEPAIRSRWVVSPAPRFAATPGSFLAGVIPPLPTLMDKVAGA